MTVSLDQMIAFMTDCVAGAPDPYQRDMNAALLSRLQQLREAQGALEWASNVAKIGPPLTPDRDYALEEKYEQQAAQLRALVETEGE